MLSSTPGNASREFIGKRDTQGQVRTFTLDFAVVPALEQRRRVRFAWQSGSPPNLINAVGSASTGTKLRVLRSQHLRAENFGIKQSVLPSKLVAETAREADQLQKMSAIPEFNYSLLRRTLLSHAVPI